MIISVKDLKDIHYFMVVIYHRILLLWLWSRIKKQSIYIDTTKYKFKYYLKKLPIYRWSIYLPIAESSKGIKFVTLTEFKESKEYKVLYLY